MFDDVGATGPMATGYARRVRACSESRQIALGANPITQNCNLEPLNAEEHKEALERLVYEVGSRTGEHAARSVELGAREGIERMLSTDTGRGVKTGITDLDRLLGGLERGTLIVIGARPSVGKSSLALVMAHNLAMVGERVLIFSLEMSEPIVIDRLTAINTGLSLKRIREKTLSPDDRTEATMALEQIGRTPMFIDATSNISVMGMRSTIRRLSRRDKLAAVFVDYLQFVKPHEGKSRVEEVGGISRGLKAMAREFDVPVIAAAQLNRHADDRDVPVLSDLRESGSIEADADVVMFVHRPNRTEDDHLSEECQLIVAKNRNGPTRSVKLYFEHKPARFLPAAQGVPL
jgi:replicative DNA helicase